VSPLPASDTACPIVAHGVPAASQVFESEAPDPPTYQVAASAAAGAASASAHTDAIIDPLRPKTRIVNPRHRGVNVIYAALLTPWLQGDSGRSAISPSSSTSTFSLKKHTSPAIRPTSGSGSA
jgi:hypothetical protein